MKILVLGAGAMGSIYGGHLSLNNEVYLVDKNKDLVRQINEAGLVIHEDGKDVVYHPRAVTSTESIAPVDLVIVFVKSLYTKVALEENKNVIGDSTYILTLQNGAGHEDVLSEFVPKERMILGTTEDNGTIFRLGHVRHGGTGKTNLGLLTVDTENILVKYKDVFDACGFHCCLYDNIQQLIWDKLFTNVSLSVVTGILQVPIGYIAANKHAWNMTEQLIHEAIQVANAMGLIFDETEITERIRQTSINSPEGLTSIYVDIKEGRKTEVNTISGSVVKAAAKVGIAVPTHQFVVNMIHAMESDIVHPGM